MKYKLDISHVVAFDNDRLIEGAKPLLTKFDVKQSPMTAIVYFMDHATELFEKYEHMIELAVADIDSVYAIKLAPTPDYLIGESYTNDKEYTYYLMCDDAKVFAELKMKL